MNASTLALWLRLIATAAALVLAPLKAAARIEVESAYTKQQTYSAALRYLRVDRDFEVVEKDFEAGYLLFEYRAPGDAKLSSRGSVEIVEGKGRVLVFIQLPRMPAYHERVLRDGLLRKLSEEYGTPPEKRKRRKKKPPESRKPQPSTEGDQPRATQRLRRQ